MLDPDADPVPPPPPSAARRPVEAAGDHGRRAAGGPGPGSRRRPHRGHPLARAALARSRRSASAPRCCGGPRHPGARSATRWSRRSTRRRGGCTGSWRTCIAVARHEAGGVVLPARPLALGQWLPRLVAAGGPGGPAPARPDHRAAGPAAGPGRRRRAGPGHPEPALQLASATRRTACRSTWSCRRAQDGWLSLEVLDRGPGVDPVEAERLFEPFYRAAAAEAAGSGGGPRAGRRPTAAARDGRRDPRLPTRRRRRFAVMLPWRRLTRHDGPDAGRRPAGEVRRHRHLNRNGCPRRGRA